MVKIDAYVHVEKHILAVGQALNAQVQQRVHEMAGIDAGPHKADTPLPLIDRVVHGQDHAAAAGRLHDPQVCQLLLGQDRILKGLQGVS